MIGALSSSGPAAVKKMTLNAVPSADAVETWTSLGATSHASRTTSPWGLTGAAPVTAVRSATVPTMPLPTSSRSS